VYSSSPGVMPAPTGGVTFYDSGQPLSGSVIYNGLGTTLTATLPYLFSTGTHAISASYSGDANFSGSATPAPLSLAVVDRLATTIPYLNGYSSLANQPSTLSVNVNSSAMDTGPVMTGAVVFFDGGIPMAGNVSVTSLSGYMVASLPYTFTTAGTHNITVQYGGDGHYGLSQSPVFAVHIVGPVGVTIPGGNSTSMPSAGGTGSSLLEVVNSTSSSASVSLGCKPDSTAATCSIDPASVSVLANSMAGATFTFSVPGHSDALHQKGPLGAPFVIAGVLTGLSLANRRKRMLTLVLLTAGLIIITAGSCGKGTSGGGSVIGSGSESGGGSGGSTSSSTYNFTITAASGGYVDTQVVTVTVQ
jgi:hypothetical protein